MKKSIISLCFLLFLACSKKDDKEDSTSNSTPVSAFNKTNVIGTWNLDKGEVKDVLNDSIIDTDTYANGFFTIIFGANDNLMEIIHGDTSHGTYAIVKSNNKNILIISRLGDNDSTEVISFSSTSLIISNKKKAIFLGSHAYVKSYFTKY